MNKIRREKLTEIISKLEDLRFDIDFYMEEEKDARDNLPENLEGSERYERMDTAAGALEEAVFDIDSAIEEIQNAIDA